MPNFAFAVSVEPLQAEIGKTSLGNSSSDFDGNKRQKERQTLEPTSFLRAAPCWRYVEHRESLEEAVQKEKNTFLISELSGHDPEGKEYSPFDDVPSGCAAADERLIKRSEEDRVFTLLQDSPDASMVFRGLADGLKKSEIIARYSLDEKRYAAALRRIRVRLLAERNDENRGR